MTVRQDQLDALGNAIDGLRAAWAVYEPWQTVVHFHDTDEFYDFQRALRGLVTAHRTYKRAMSAAVQGRALGTLGKLRKEDL